jgi:hypothetical protein
MTSEVMDSAFSLLNTARGGMTDAYANFAEVSWGEVSRCKHSRAVFCSLLARRGFFVVGEPWHQGRGGNGKDQERASD